MRWIAILGLLAVLGLPLQAAPSLKDIATLIAQMKGRDETLRLQAAEKLAQWRDQRAVPLLAPLCHIPAAAEAACKTLGKIGGKGVDALLAMEGDKQRWVRMKALKGLGASDDPRAVKAVRAALKNADAEVRAVAVTTLQLRPKAPDFINVSLAALNDTSAHVRFLAIAGLRDRINQGDPVVLESLLNKLSDPDPEVRSFLVQLLRLTRDPRLVEPLLAMLREESADHVLRAATDLGLLGDPRAVPALLETAQAWVKRLPSANAPEDGDGHAAVTVMERVTGALAQFSDPRAAAAIIALARDPHPHARQAALNALIDMAAPQVTDVLCDALRDSDVVVRQIASQIARRYLHEPRIREALWVAADDADINVRHAAVSSLSALKEPRTVDLLLILLKSTDSTLHRTAINGLGNSDDPRAVQALLVLLNTKDKDRSLIIRALAFCTDPGARDACLKLLPGATDEERLDIYRGSAYHPDPRAGDVLVAQLKQEKVPGCVAEIITALGLMYNPRVADVIAGFLDKRQAIGVRGAALVALARLGDARAMNLLLNAMNDPRLKPYAMQGLGIIGGPKAFEALQADARDRRPVVRERTLPALGQTGDPRATQFLIDALASPYPEVRQAAISGLALARPDTAQAAIDPLIAAMERTASLTEREAITRALKNLTGQELGTDPARWRAWQESLK